MDSIRMMLKSRWEPEPQVLLDPQEGNHEWEVKINPSWRRWADNRARNQWMKFKRNGNWPEAARGVSEGEFVDKYIEDSIDDYISRWKKSKVHRLPMNMFEDGAKGVRYFLDEPMLAYARSNGADIMRSVKNPHPFKVPLDKERGVSMLYDAATDKIYSGLEYRDYLRAKEKEENLETKQSNI